MLAELYDLEHDEVTDDLPFYRSWAGRQRGAVIDLGCGSGRLFPALLAGGAAGVVGVDGSAALLRRAEARVETDPDLRAARDAGRLELVHGDVRSVSRTDRFSLALLAGVIAHLSGPEEAVRALSAAARLLDGPGVLIVDTVGPGGLPTHDLPVSVDWERTLDGRRVVRRSSLERHESPEGLRVDYATLTDLQQADGTIARLPARFRLWYPSPSAVVALAGEAGLEVVAAFGSYDQRGLDERSERCIAVLRRAAHDAGEG